MAEAEIISGEVYEIIFANEENGYTVLALDSEEEGLVTCVGIFPYLKEGELISVTGKWTNHPSYGEQFKAETFKKHAPSGKRAVLNYLSAGVVKGVRSSTAKKIVDYFGEEALAIIKNQPERLAEIKGISHKKAIEIGESYALVEDREQLIMFLQGFGISPSFAMRIYDTLGVSALTQIRENPYVLCEQIRGITFKSCDLVAENLGISPNNINRIKSGIKYTLLNYAISGGHTYLPREVLVDVASKALSLDKLEVENAIVTLLMEQGLKNCHFDGFEGTEAIYLPVFYESEKKIAYKIKRLSEEKILKEDVDAYISELEAELGIELEEKQRLAVKTAASSGVLVITGGPGTGKTTIIKFIIRLFEKMGLSVALSAPTGRAAKRMTSLSGREAKTVHRLLEVGFGGDDILREFTRNEDLPLDYDAVILDEASMMDVLLTGSLCAALNKNARLILVGDVDQLPPVGAGNVLKDIISAELVPVVRLSSVFRQAAESMIVVNAHKINKGEYPIYNEKDKDFYFVSASGGTEKIADMVADVVKNRLPKAYGFDAKADIQVITPMKKTASGVFDLNVKLQEALNPPSESKKEKNYLNRIYREGDKVMQIRNNYDLVWTKADDKETEGTGIFNGDMGVIEKVEKSSVTVIFDDEKRVVYENSALEDLDHAYAVTVHKSQGSEFRAVVMPAFFGAPRLMNRNLIYTAVTRAKELVVIVGQKNAVEAMVDNNHELKRYSSLDFWLKSID